MRAGLMDPHGERATAGAQEEAVMGLGFALVSAALWGGIVAMIAAA
jgi:hypothetical protein